MARFDVYPHPDAQLRKKTPFLLDVQNEFLGELATRVVIPLRGSAGFSLRVSKLNPVLKIGAEEVVLDTAAIAAFPASQLKRSTVNLTRQADAVTHALDALFGAY